MLTRKQHQLLTFIEERLQDTGISPSYDEMRDALKLQSKSGIHRLITSLEERGFIRRLAHKARAVEVVRLPENMAEMHPHPPASPDGNLAPRQRFRNAKFAAHMSSETAPPALIPFRQVEVAPGAAAISLPLPGKIAAGTPISALTDTSGQIDVPVALIPTSGEHYALTIEGDSMVEAGILDGDTVIINRCSTADNGAIVVALIDEEEATLKRIRKNGDTVSLEPANRHYKTMIYETPRVRVQGRLVGLMRGY